MSDRKLVWSDESGDLRKAKAVDGNSEVQEKDLVLNLRRLTSGKGRTVVEITALPNNKKWCQKLAKDLKKSLGVGGAYKNNFIEVHGEKMDQVISVLESKSIKWKKIGG